MRQCTGLDFVNFIRRALSVDPTKRFAHAGAMLEEDGESDDWEEPKLQVVVSDPDLGDGNPALAEATRRSEVLPEAVDRLLNQLREIT